jgi:DNA mismatch repair protein MutS
MSALTRPMYRKYQAAWEEAAAKYGPRTALLYQVGGFFELYDTENLTTGTSTANIRQIAELCQLSLTTHVVEGGDGAGGKDKGNQFQTLFGGFPEAALPKFEKILVNAGYTVLVVTQRKGRTGQVEERAVDHIASPGCYVEGARERRLVGVVLESLPGPAALRRVYWAAAALDVATGQSWITEGTDRDRLHQFLCLYAPSELVLWSDGHSDLTESLRGLCAAVHVRALTPAAAAVDHAALERLWAPIHQRLEWLPRLPQARRCVAGLMEFAAEHMPSALRVAPVPTVWVPDGEVRLGNAALEQLGLLSLRDEGGVSSLLGLMDQCRSIAGRRLMRSRLMRPIADVAEIGRRLDAVDAAAARRKDAVVTATTERCLRSLYDLSRLWRRVELGSAGIGDMACLLRAYEAARGLMDLWPAVPAGCREYLDWVAARWSAGVATDLAREGITVPVAALPFVTGSRPAVEAAFAVGVAIRREAEEVCRAWSGLGRAEALYLDDAEGGGFRVTGTKRRISAVWTALRDGGDASASMTAYKNTVLLETAGLTAISERHRKWWVGWQAAWFTAWSEALTELVDRGRAAHAALESWCAELDLSWTVSDLAATWLWKRPEIVDGAAEGFVEVERLRHPILERIVTGPYVTHTVGLQGALGGGGPVGTTPRGLLLYGMNASGKSSLMKALGLAVLLAQCGFPVPAARLRLSPFTAIFTRILGNDNLWAGLSSFAVEMTEFREILRHADERSLVLGDELCSGTESLSATALVAAGVETLANRGTKFVFATHLHELATLPDIAGHSGVRAVHLKVHYDAATDVLVYDRHLAEGSGSALYGLEVCRALDLPPGYLERATSIRQGLAGSVISHVSAYSNGAVVRSCEVCGSGAGLETHHIRHQADAAAAAAEGFDLNAPGNLVCLCATCHDDHHGGRLTIRGWEETSAGRRLVWTRVGAGGSGAGKEANEDGLTDEVVTWIRDQKKRRARVATIQRMVQQLFGVTVSEKTIRALR